MRLTIPSKSPSLAFQLLVVVVCLVLPISVVVNPCGSRYDFVEATETSTRRLHANSRQPKLGLRTRNGRRHRQVRKLTSQDDVTLPTQKKLMNPHGLNTDVTESIATNKVISNRDSRRPRLGVRTRNARHDRRLQTSGKTESMPMTGGYSPVPDFKDDSFILEAAEFAFQELRSPSSPYLLSQDPAKAPEVVKFRIIRASKQVVAGLNIRLDVIFQDQKGGCVGAGTVVVYNHFGDLSISSWKTKEGTCRDLDSNGRALTEAS